ncbi:MAG: Bax inhibitor-1/YccA family protein [Pseudoclavibacter sp.]
MDNPVLSRNPYFNGKTPQVGETATADQLRQMYDRPAGAEPQTQQTQQGFPQQTQPQAFPAAGSALPASERMTYDGVIVKTAMLFGTILVGAVVGWMFPVLLLPGVIVGLVLGLVNSFKKQPSVPLILAYGVFEGLFVGAISQVFATTYYGGIVVQAVLATLSVFAVTLVLFCSGKVRASAKGAKILMIAMGGYLLFSLINVGMMVFGATSNPFGVLGMQIFGIPVGVIVGILVVIMAAYSLVLDFDMVKTGVQQGAPAKFGWTAAFGIAVTVIWLYVEFLRLFAILASSRD